ncbi:HlyD family efflux transporter periplasmic adaptor subunit [Lentisphaerota bacterium WC36G]|nr:HlyD family efflux transporter periplasmic adaptor subunit [Lentisphaerae bacterium WC36]
MNKKSFKKLFCAIGLFGLTCVTTFAANGENGKNGQTFADYIGGLPFEAKVFFYVGLLLIILLIALAIAVWFLVTNNILHGANFDKEGNKISLDVSNSTFIKRHGITFFRIFAILIILSIGYSAYTVLKAQSLKPRSKPQSQSMRVLEGRDVKLNSVMMSLDGFGIVRPLQEICLSSEIKGRIVTKKADLKSGIIVNKGDLLCEIDISDYKENLMQLEAEIVRLDEETAMKRQTVKDLENEVVQLEKIYEIEKKNYERYLALYKRNVSSKTDAENAQKSMITQLKALINLKSSISKTKIEIRSLDASKQKAISTVRRAKLDIQRSKIYAPFAGRILNVYIENGEYVNVGTKLFDIANDSRLEIPVSLNAVDVARILGLSTTAIKSYENWMTTPDLPPVNISWTEDSSVCRWLGKVVRIEGFNSTDGTVTLVVNPTKSLIAANAPSVPLVSGMYCRVTFSGSSVNNAMIVPWSAIQSNSTIFLVDKENRGHEVKTTIISSDNDSVVISQGLEHAEGYKIVTQRLPNNVVNGSIVRVVPPISDPNRFVEDNIAELNKEKQSNKKNKKQKAAKKKSKNSSSSEVQNIPAAKKELKPKSAMIKLPLEVIKKSNNINFS